MSVCLHPCSNIEVYLRDGPAQTSARAATLRQKLQIKLAISLVKSQYTDTRPTSSHER